MPVPVIYRTGGENISTYDWFDLASQAGYKRYYATAAEMSGSTSYFLSTKTLDGSPPYFNDVLSGSTAYMLLHDFDFDMTCNSPICLNGTALINVSHNIQQASSYSQVIFNLYHVDVDNAETLIGTANTPIEQLGSPTYYRECLKMLIAKTAFKFNEILRLNVQHWGNKDNAVNGGSKIYYDPTSRSTITDQWGGTSGTDLYIDIPFKIDL